MPHEALHRLRFLFEDFPKNHNFLLRSSEGIRHAVRNLCTGAPIEAVRDRVKTVGLDQVNMLMQPHWRHNTRTEPAGSGAATNQQAGLKGWDGSF